MYTVSRGYSLDLSAIISLYSPTGTVKFICARTLQGPSWSKGLCSGDLLIWQPGLLSLFILNFFASSHSVGIASRRGIGSGFNKETKAFKIDHLMSYLDCLGDWKQFISESDLLCRCPFSPTKLGAGLSSKVVLGEGSGLDK